MSRRTRVVGADKEKEYYEYQWGDRAEAEVKKSDVLKMVCQVYDCEPRMFKEHYDMVSRGKLRGTVGRVTQNGSGEGVGWLVRS